MVPISVKKFAEITAKGNKDINKGELMTALNEALKRKNNGWSFLYYLRSSNLGGRLGNCRNRYVLYLYHW